MEPYVLQAPHKKDGFGALASECDAPSPWLLRYQKQQIPGAKIDTRHDQLPLFYKLWAAVVLSNGSRKGIIVTGLMKRFFVGLLWILCFSSRLLPAQSLDAEDIVKRSVELTQKDWKQKIGRAHV